MEENVGAQRNQSRAPGTRLWFFVVSLSPVWDSAILLRMLECCRLADIAVDEARGCRKVVKV